MKTDFKTFSFKIFSAAFQEMVFTELGKNGIICIDVSITDKAGKRHGKSDKL